MKEAKLILIKNKMANFQFPQVQIIIVHSAYIVLLLYKFKVFNKIGIQD